ncbi:integrase arm-type DNA-binding domain-containing protein [Acidithiobacillus sp. VAN18-1]|uniref:Integrase arm-type DNA-binding domain-containing protein n=1 Tax=Igneacidithiobacillus copahuensis TaxID=2724909 RepID=A0AAE2YRH3_9PROT|nr:site-specific integrase [Igneacidithiobacillus copahuensis]MBU2788926.1 integrase arm-type DNA-binding domain-containing protein [Igneacidithiobacillus copahuensis]MBU2795547.1 integrase arm-type DNA-binding domain-containing protein [Acidithiobacillus sp. VAN18-2]
MGKHATAKLTAKQIEHAKTGTHSDGGGLYLRVRASGSKSWVFRAKVGGTVREYGLGSASTTSAKDARDKAAHARQAIADGLDPDAVLNPKPEKPSLTFEQVARDTIEAKAPEWRNFKHRQQWENTLLQYVFPIIGSKPVAQITVEDVLRVLKPLWIEKTETATRLRQRIEAVLDRAAVLGLRDRDRVNPASWRGNLEHLLPKPRKVAKREHFEAIPHSDLPRVMAGLRGEDTVTAACARFIALCACRSGEARGAQWSEVDLVGRVWTIPASRTKTGKPHTVPLAAEAMDILRGLAVLGSTGLIFPPSRTTKNPISDVAVTKALRRYSEAGTIHGLRSSFRDWAAEQTHFPRETVEACLAHAIGSVEAAYRRTDLLERRREVMDAWARYLDEKKSVIVALRSGS